MANIDKQNPLYLKIVKHFHATGTSYALSSDEIPTAKKMVKNSLLFYAMDYEHVMPYKDCHE
jgi:hypothetical protein